MAVVREKNELGRIKNADNSPLIFYPRTVLRPAEVSAKNGVPTKSLWDLVNALNNGFNGGIGPFEINILVWSNKLRYVTNTMLLDLIKAGYISFGEKNFTQEKLRRTVNRMSKYNLVTLSRFITVSDDGNFEIESRSSMRVITMGKNGNRLLYELGKLTSNFNYFDIFQDGNTVKRYLAANQWLVYLLAAYGEEIGENYETSYILYQKGVDYAGVRIYASVTLNGLTMIAEPIRRSEEFETERTRQDFREKIGRMILMFDSKDQLYRGKYKMNKVYFPGRPVIVIICEDDNHIQEVLETVRPIVSGTNQEVWFSSDLRIFNYDKRRERFLCVRGNELQPVDFSRIIP